MAYYPDIRDSFNSDNPRDYPEPDEWGRMPGDPDYGRPPGDVQTPGPEPPDPTDPGPPAPAPAPTPTPTPTPTPNPIGPFTQTFQQPSWQSSVDLPDAPIPELPGFTPPPAFSYDPYTPAGEFSYDSYAPAQPFSYQDFRAPSIEEAVNSPGYQFRFQQGNEGLQRWAAARGTLNDSGTAKALIEHGQNVAGQEYANVWNRDFDAHRTNRAGAFDAYNLNEGNRFRDYTTNRTNALDTFNLNEGNRFNAYQTNRAGAVNDYNTNYQTQYIDPYRFEYQRAVDRFAPQMEDWRVNSAAVLGVNQDNYANAWNEFMADYGRWKDNRDTAIDLAAM